MESASGHTNASADPAGRWRRVVLSVKKVLAGRGAVDYYLAQTRRGLADYYLPDATLGGVDGAGDGRSLAAPDPSWWGGSAQTLGLSGTVERAQFVPMFAKGARPDGDGYLGHRFRLPEQAAAAKAQALTAAAEIDDPYERWASRHQIRSAGGRASVAAWDCTFSPVKSVSLLWAAGDPQLRAQVWSAHLAAVDAGLTYLEEHAGYVRAGRNGIRVLDTDGLVVARMNEWTSRAGDMQLHTHCLVLNRARTVEDGKWRALDGRALLAARTGAGALYNRVLEAELTRRLGVGWRDRPDGLRELAGVDDELIDTFSTRRRAITARVAAMADAYRDRYGIDPPPAIVSAMAQHATLATRPSKQDPDPAGALDAWEAQARAAGRRLSRLPANVVDRQPRTATPAPQTDDRQVAALVARLASSGRATFDRHGLLRAALDVLDPAELAPDRLRGAAERLAEAAARTPALVSVTAADPLPVAPSLRRADGTSVYVRPHRDRWTLAATLDRERWLLQVADEPAGAPVDPAAVDKAVTVHGLGDDQATAVRELLGDRRRVGLLIGPAGAGKTRTLRAVVDGWQAAGRPVAGLTVSQAAARVLADQAQLPTTNIAKWQHEHRAGNWRLPDGVLLIVDEASMVATTDLVDLVDQTRRAGGRVLLVGDPAQLAAVQIGGAFGLLAERHGAAQLTEIRRFTHPWERIASSALRRRDPAALADYAMRDRIHGGTRDQIETGLFDAWRTDALTPTADGSRPAVLMIVATNEQAAVLGERARHTLLAAGTVSDGTTVTLADNVASVGDHLVTRRNDRRLTTDGDDRQGWVVNGDLWTITGVHDDGAAAVTRHGDGAKTTLPADYLARHAQLGYATTAHRAQGLTVDIAHAAIDHATDHRQLYVSATRGRHANHLWVTLDTDQAVVHDPDDLPDPLALLTRTLARPDPDRLAAHQIAADAQAEIGSLARLGAIFEDAARTATTQWLHDRLADHGLSELTGEPAWPALIDQIRHAALAGHDTAALLDHALGLRPLDGSHSPAAVLHWRLTTLTDQSTPVRRPGPLTSLPPTDGPAINVARHAGELIRQRWRDLRRQLATTTGPVPGLDELGPRPADPRDAATWLTAATAVAAYRERFTIPDHQPMLGPRPTVSRPDAQAAWDHARRQADRHLARRLRDLDTDQLDTLDRRQQAIIDARPGFDPEQLDAAHRRLDQHSGDGDPSTRTRLHHRAERLEQQAAAHRRWRTDADRARNLQRQIALETRRRAATSTRRPVAHRR